MIPNAAIASPCAYVLPPGSVITGAAFVGCCGSGGSGAGVAAVTVTVKSSVTSGVTPSFAVTVTVQSCTVASDATVPDT